jgi:hypothetical protein
VYNVEVGAASGRAASALRDADQIVIDRSNLKSRQFSS